MPRVVREGAAPLRVEGAVGWIVPTGREGALREGVVLRGAGTVRGAVVALGTAMERVGVLGRAAGAADLPGALREGAVRLPGLERDGTAERDGVFCGTGWVARTVGVRAVSGVTRDGTALPGREVRARSCRLGAVGTLVRRVGINEPARAGLREGRFGEGASATLRDGRVASVVAVGRVGAGRSQDALRVAA